MTLRGNNLRLLGQAKYRKCNYVSRTPDPANRGAAERDPLLIETLQLLSSSYHG